MKKILSVMLVSLLVLTGCGSKNNDPKPEGTRIGFGSAITESYTEDKATYESNTTYAAVVLDGDKIEYVHIDTAQNSFKVDGDKAVDFVGKGTKKERGKDYGMVEFGGSKLEWNEQIAEVEKFMVGKTISEVEKGKGDSDLNSKVSINIDGYIAAVKTAIANAIVVEGVDKIAVGSVTSLAADKYQINTDLAAIAVDADGKIVYAFFDGAQTGAKVAEGKAAVGGVVKTKKQLGTDYGMSKWSDPKAVAEWDVQATEFEKYAIGKTIAEVLGMPTYVKDDAHPNVPSGEDIKSKVTIDVSGFFGVIEHIKGNLTSVK